MNSTKKAPCVQDTEQTKITNTNYTARLQKFQAIARYDQKLTTFTDILRPLCNQLQTILFEDSKTLNGYDLDLFESYNPERMMRSFKDIIDNLETTLDKLYEAEEERAW